MFTTTSITAVSVSIRKAQSTHEIAGRDPVRDLDAGLARAEADLDEGDPGQSRRDPEQRGGDDLARARADQAAEEAGDQEADQRQEDDGVIHRRQPRIMLMSSTAIEPRLRIEDDENGEPDRGFGGRDREHEQREDLADDVVQDASRRRRG